MLFKVSLLVFIGLLEFASGTITVATGLPNFPDASSRCFATSANWACWAELKNSAERYFTPTSAP